jgi:hypothetical protein
VLEKVCEYFYYNEKHKNSKDVPDIDVPAELCLELLMAADYLNGEFIHSHHVSSYGAVCSATKLTTIIDWDFFWGNGVLTTYVLQFDRGDNTKS